MTTILPIFMCPSCELRRRPSMGYDQNGKKRYRKECDKCAGRPSREERRRKSPTSFKSNRKTQAYKKTYCEKCGFVAKRPIQLDVDHIDGNSKNNNPENFQTLCANCHRLKTFLNEDWKINN